jgi:hypothetical protein
MRRLCCLAAVALAAAGCGTGASGRSGTATDRAAPAAPPPALVTAPRRPGEVVVAAEASPVTAGPYDFHGVYRVRFQQYAPEAPRTDFAGQTAFVVDLERSPGRGAQRLFRAAAASGERRVRLEGRLYVDVSFGDFPFAVRFTPDRR